MITRVGTGTVRMLDRTSRAGIGMALSTSAGSLAGTKIRLITTTGIARIKKTTLRRIRISGVGGGLNFGGTATASTRINLSAFGDNISCCITHMGRFNSCLAG